MVCEQIWLLFLCGTSLTCQGSTESFPLKWEDSVIQTYVK